MALRKLKGDVRALLQGADFEAGLQELAAMPARRVINPLFGLLYDGDSRTRWRAITAMGRVAADLAAREIESARVIMRRLMWNLNDESGGIGWGSPEAMGEIMACHFGLAREYAVILLSYLDPARNYLEHEGLQLGVIWGIGRLARVHPQLTEPACFLLSAFWRAADPQLRGLALWAAQPMACQARDRPAHLRDDPSEVIVYEQDHFRRYSIAELAFSPPERC